MPKILIRLSLLMVFVFSVLACVPTNGTSGSTNPNTPVASPVAATQTLPAKTEMPGPPKPATTPFTFSQLEVSITSVKDAGFVLDETGWPAEIFIPAEGYALVALRCDGGMEMEFVTATPMTELKIGVNCASSAELLVVIPVEAGRFHLIGIGETLAESHVVQDGLNIYRWIFEAGIEDRLVDWSSKS